MTILLSLIFFILLSVSASDGQWWNINTANQVSAGKNTNSVAWAFYEVNASILV
jgi:hypothetical protein